MEAERAQLESDQAPARQSLVLIIEDEEYARRALALLLQRMGYLTQAVGSAEEGLKIVESPHPTPTPDVALVDYNLPGQNGIDFIRRISQLRPGITPVLITSAPESEVGPAISHLKFSYLAKPLELRLLLRILRDAAKSPTTT